MPTAIFTQQAENRNECEPTPMGSSFSDQQIQHFFTWSPFGVGCRLSTNKVTIQLDERCIGRYLKKHGMDCRVSTIRLLLAKLATKVGEAMASGTIEPFRHDSIVIKG
jgi:hypothetical protein